MPRAPVRARREVALFDAAHGVGQRAHRRGGAVGQDACEQSRQQQATGGNQRCTDDQFASRLRTAQARHLHHDHAKPADRGCLVTVVEQRVGSRLHAEHGCGEQMVIVGAFEQRRRAEAIGHAAFRHARTPCPGQHHVVAVEHDQPVDIALAQRGVGDRLQDVDVAGKQTVLGGRRQARGEQHGAVDQRALDVGDAGGREMDSQRQRDRHRWQQSRHQHTAAESESIESEPTPHPASLRRPPVYPAIMIRDRRARFRTSWSAASAWSGGRRG